MNREQHAPARKVFYGFRRRGVILPIYAILCTALLAAITIRANANSSQAHAVPAQVPAPDKAYGSKNAPITLEVFADYQCPVCRAFYETTVRRMLDAYVASGKVYLIHRDFPLTMHRYSGEAARWANACAQVGDFGSAEEALYDNQEAWAADGNIGKFIAATMPASDFKRVQLLMKNSPMPAPQATGASLDPMAGILHPCPVDPYIVRDIKLGYQAHVGGTPTFVITYKGHQFSGSAAGLSWPVLKQFFDSLLRQ